MLEVHKTDDPRQDALSVPALSSCHVITGNDSDGDGVDRSHRPTWLPQSDGGALRPLKEVAHCVNQPDCCHATKIVPG